jgi:hypothetical protein
MSFLDSGSGIDLGGGKTVGEVDAIFCGTGGSAFGAGTNCAGGPAVCSAGDTLGICTCGLAANRSPTGSTTRRADACSSETRMAPLGKRQ